MKQRRECSKRKRSLMVRLFFLICVMILAPSLLTLLVFYRTIPDRMEEQAKGNADFYISQVAAYVANSMELARDIANNAMRDSSLRTSMQDMETYLSVQGRDALVRIVGGVAAYKSAWSNGAINNVYLFRQDGQYAFYSSFGSYAQEQLRMQMIFDAAGELSSSETLFVFENMTDDAAYFLLDYKNIYNLDLLGKMIIEIDVDTMLNAGDLIELYPDTCVALSNDDGQLLYGLGEELDLLLERTDDETLYVQGTASGKQGRYYHVSYKIDDNDLWLDIFIPLPSMYGLVWESIWIFSILCIVILMLAVLAAASAYRVLRKPLQSMVNTLRRMSESDYAARMPESGYRELAELEVTFNQMADNLEESWNDAYRKGVWLQESESRLLAAQINPHFIFNVLETINMRCVDAGLKNISHMVTDLAQLLRGNIGAGRNSQKIPFEQELRYINYYLNLQRERFGESLSYSVEYENEELLQYLVPRLTIQPLVENAIVHGLEPRRGLGRVTVRLWEETQNIYVRVEDNGVGFDTGQLNTVAEEESTGLHNHIALENVRRRLHLLYGDQADFQISSKLGCGTSVMLILPIDSNNLSEY